VELSQAQLKVLPASHRVRRCKRDTQPERLYRRYSRAAEDGSLTWLPLVHGEGPLTPANGFADQAEVLIKTRFAADALGATKMDRPEDFEADPVTGHLFVVLTKNAKRKPDQLDGANSRAGNKWGQIIELLPPGEGKDADHAATEGRWDVFLLAGDPSKPEEGAKYGAGVSANGWFFNPDNIAFDPKGRMWIATDGSIDFGIADGLYGTRHARSSACGHPHVLCLPHGR
jgi:secreted PhoX family phosphatase